MSASLRVFAFAFFAFRPHVDPVTWCEANLSLSSLVTEAPGPYSTRLFPYVREPLNCFADNKVSDVVLCWGAQTAKTTTVAAGILERIANSPSPTLIVQPTTDNAQSFAESRLVPLFESAEQLRRLKPKERDRFKKTEWLLSTCNVNLVGSNSPANLASRPVGLLVCDETDKFSEGSAKEAGAIQLAVERTKAFQSAKRVYTSTPTTDSGAIWGLFLQGDQRYYHCPCPHCRELIRLEWGQVEWDQEARDERTEIWDYQRVQSSAHYKCQRCGGKITDAHKTKILREGVWIASNPTPLPGWRSYHLNSLYSVAITFGKLAVKWLQAKHGNLSDLQNFINSTLAEPWRDRTSPGRTAHNRY
jgi:phage terminase large subunit GpA-like protein